MAAQKIIIHAGFHKTGSKTLQAVFRENRKALKPWGVSIFKWKLAPAVAAAHAYGTLPVPWRQERLQACLASIFEDLPETAPVPLILFSEDFCGPMVGLNGVTGYQSAPVIAKELHKAATLRFGEDIDFKIFYNLRNRKSWIDSLYRHHVTYGALADPFPDFVANYQPGSDLEAVLSTVKDKIGGDKVYAQWLEQSTSHRLGTAMGMLTLLGVPLDVLDSLTPVGVRNLGPDRALVERFLEMNKANLDADELKHQKLTLLTKMRQKNG